jgi:hypothetical protein
LSRALFALARKISETRFITLIDAAVPFIHVCAAQGGFSPPPDAIQHYVVPAVVATRVRCHQLLLLGTI